MNNYGKLTELLTSKPLMDPRRLIKYAHSKSLNIKDLLKLAVLYDSLDKASGREVTLFHLACTKSKPELVRALIREGWSINTESSQVGTPLLVALDRGNIPVARLLIEMGVDINLEVISRDFSPMSAALANSKPEKTCVSAVKLLLDFGFSINAVLDERTGERPIHLATVNNLPKVVSLLLKNGVDPNALDANRLTALHIAAFNNYVKIVKLFLLHGVELYVENVCESPILGAVRNNCEEVVEVLVRGGLDVNRLYDQGAAAALHTAVRLLNVTMITLLIDLGADPNLELIDGITPLRILATRHKAKVFSDVKEGLKVRKDVAEFLIEKGAKVNTVIENGLDSPLYIAVDNGFLGLAKVFIRHGANLNIRDIDSCQTLFHEVVPLNRDIIVQFLAYGGDYNDVNYEKLSPYHLAIIEQIDVKFVKTFVKHGCPYNQHPKVWNKVAKRCTAVVDKFFMAEKQFFKGIMENNLDLVKAAVKVGAIVTGCSEEVRYPLHFLAHNGYIDLLTFLLLKNFPPNIINDEGESALYLAAKQGHFTVCCILLRFGACYNHSNMKCSKSPKAVAKQQNHQDVVDLLHGLGRMFKLASLGKKQVVKKLKELQSECIEIYLSHANAINNKGKTLLATALQHNCKAIHEEMIKLRFKQML